MWIRFFHPDKIKGLSLALRNSLTIFNLKSRYINPQLPECQLALFDHIQPKESPMKKLFLFFALFSPFAIFAQNNEGIVIYTQTMNLRREITDEQMKRMVPEKQQSNAQLTITPKATLFKEIAADPDPSASTDGPGGGMRMMIRRMVPTVYRDLEKNRVLEESDFFGKAFLVDDVPVSYAWKVTGQQKMIGTYPCISATTVDSTMGRARSIMAWFTPGIPVQSGPMSYAGLPGLILEVDVNNGSMVMTATEIKMGKLDDKSAIKIPEKGKRVTREEYRKTVREKMKEMQEMNGGQPGMNRVIIRN
jgi:GLPGLI family protein